MWPLAVLHQREKGTHKSLQHMMSMQELGDTCGEIRMILPDLQGLSRIFCYMQGLSGRWFVLSWWIFASLQDLKSLWPYPMEVWKQSYTVKEQKDQQLIGFAGWLTQSGTEALKLVKLWHGWKASTWGSSDEYTGEQGFNIGTTGLNLLFLLIGQGAIFFNIDRSKLKSSTMTSIKNQHIPLANQHLLFGSGAGCVTSEQIVGSCRPNTAMWIFGRTDPRFQKMSQEETNNHKQ